MHSGYNLMPQFVDILSKYNNLMFDLSYTINKKSTNFISSLISDYDIRFCVGSDWPEFNINETYNKILLLDKKISKNKFNKMCYGNLCEIYL